MELVIYLPVFYLVIGKNIPSTNFRNFQIQDIKK